MSDADPDEPVEETRLSPMAFPPVFRPQPRVEWTDAAGHHAKVIDGRVIVEIKCKETLHPVDQAQLLSHLRLLNIQVGLLMNFHVVQLKDGIKRMVNNYQPDDGNGSKLLATG